MKRRGFTLIELLVVVSIIALLIAILLPSIGKAKSMAVRTQCASVLRQWGTVVKLYQAEWNGVWFIKSGGGQAWNSTGSAYATQWAAKFNQKMRTCPGEPEKANTGATLYTMVRPAPLVSNVVQWNELQVRTPTRLLIMSDSDAPTSNPWFTSMADQPMVNLKTVLDNRHRGTGNALFLDSHVDAARFQDFENNIPSKLDGLNVPADEMGKQWTQLRP